MTKVTELFCPPPVWDNSARCLSKRLHSRLHGTAIFFLYIFVCCVCYCFDFGNNPVPYSLWSVGALRDIWQSYLELRVDKIILWLLSKFYFCSHSHSNIWTKHTKQDCWYLKFSSCIAIYISKLWKEYFVKVKLENLFWLFLG